MLKEVRIDYKQYKGLYVAIVDNRIVASGTNAKETLDTARAKYPNKEIVLRKIPEEEAMILVISCA